MAVQELSEKLLSWINNELADERILVRDLQEDLYDGQILQKLVEKLANVKLDHPEVTQSEIGQIQRLKVYLRSSYLDLMLLLRKYCLPLTTFCVSQPLGPLKGGQPNAFIKKTW